MGFLELPSRCCQIKNPLTHWEPVIELTTRICTAIDPDHDRFLCFSGLWLSPDIQSQAVFALGVVSVSSSLHALKALPPDVSNLRDKVCFQRVGSIQQAYGGYSQSLWR